LRGRFFCAKSLHDWSTAVSGITKVTRFYGVDCGILVNMKTKNMRELEKMWAQKAKAQNNPQQKTGAPTRQTVTPAPRITRKSSRGS